MKTIRVCQFRHVNFASILFVLLIIAAVDLSAQQGKTKNNQPEIKIDVKREYDESGNVKSYDSVYSFLWSSEGINDIDSLMKSLHEQFGISPFGLDAPVLNQFDRFPESQFGKKYNDKMHDSLFGYINPDDSVYHFNSPGEQFGFPEIFNNPFFEEFFNDPFFSYRNHSFRGLDPFYNLPPDSSSSNDQLFDMRSLLEEHMKRMEEFQRHFHFDEPYHFETPDSISPKPRKQNNSLRKQNKHGGWEI